MSYWNNAEHETGNASRVSQAQQLHSSPLLIDLTLRMKSWDTRCQGTAVVSPFSINIMVL